MPGQDNILGILLEGRYRVARELGQGAMGTVYEGQHVTVGRRVAIKVLAREYTSKAARERFFHEARAAGAISHLHIVPVLDFGFLESGQPYIVMEFVEGEPLEHGIERKAPMPVDDAVEIACQILSALEVIHGAGLVHRDIKPANIMLARVRRHRVFAKLLDFGVSRAMHAAWHRPNLTRVNEVLGTPAYFSPEQAAGGEVDHRWDLWAVGVMLYEMLTGDLPFRLESMAQVISDLVNCRLIPLRHRLDTLPEWVYQIQERIHHPVRDRRYGTATAFLQALEMQRAYLANEEIEAKTVPFVRVDLDTPPPEIVGKLAESPDLQGRSRRQINAPVLESVLESQLTDHDLPSHRIGSNPRAQAEQQYQESDTTSRQERSDRLSVRRSPPEDPSLTSDVRPLPHVEPRPPAAPPAKVIPWLPLTLSVLFLIAAAVAVYFAVAT